MSNTNILRMIAATALLMAVGSANAQVLILKSTGANASGQYKAGSMIAEDTEINLEKGDQIVLLSGQATRTFNGPGTITPAGVFSEKPQAGKLNALVDFLKSSSEEHTELGAVRGIDELPADPWVVNVTTPGLKCIVQGEPVYLWRGMDIPADQAVLSNASGDNSVTFDWPMGMTESQWPEEYDLSAGETYKIDYGLGEEVEFNLAEMPAEIVDDGARLVWLAEQACFGQVLVLLEKI